MAISRRSMLKVALAGVPLAVSGSPARAEPTELTAPIGRSRWTAAQAHTWHKAQGWLVGSNYVPATAVNQIEMFAPETFDPARITTELRWASDIGLNCMRVFLHDALWAADAPGYAGRIDTFLSIASAAGIKTMLVLFDSCWDPQPKLGPQQAPRPGVHNSRWVQSPGAAGLSTEAARPALERYVTDVVRTFATDQRVLAWDVWNEPDNLAPQYPAIADKLVRVEALLPLVFSWARAGAPQQPLTSPIWSDTKPRIGAIQKAESDIISFHSYDDPDTFSQIAKGLTAEGRPALCTEFLARPLDSTVEDILPIARTTGVGAMTWGFVNGRTQTHLPWDSWERPYIDGREPEVWFHDLLRNDGTPYDQPEIDTIRRLRGVKSPAPVKRLR